MTGKFINSHKYSDAQLFFKIFLLEANRFIFYVS